MNFVQYLAMHNRVTGNPSFLVDWETTLLKTDWPDAIGECMWDRKLKRLGAFAKSVELAAVQLGLNDLAMEAEMIREDVRKRLVFLLGEEVMA